jgi:hypothetical protein
MWHVVAAYAGESSYCMKLNWLFLGPAVVLNCNRVYTVYCFCVKKKQKQKYGDVLCQKNNKHVFGIGIGK